MIIKLKIGYRVFFSFLLTILNLPSWLKVIHLCVRNLSRQSSGGICALCSKSGQTPILLSDFTVTESSIAINTQLSSFFLQNSKTACWKFNELIHFHGHSIAKYITYKIPRTNLQYGWANPNTESWLQRHAATADDRVFWVFQNTWDTWWEQPT